MQNLVEILSLVFGLVFGSFLNVVILRWPEEKNLGGRSHCPSCGHVLGVGDLVPVLSYLVLMGRCRYCHKKISPRYFLVELACGFLFWLSAVVVAPVDVGGYVLLVKYFAAAAGLLAVFFIDLEHYIILDKIVFPLAIFTLIINFVMDLLSGGSFLNLHTHGIGGLVAAAAAFVPFYGLWYFSQGVWMGFGDVKLVLWLGLLTGWPYILPALLITFALGAVVSVGLLAFTSRKLASRVPLGTFLSLGVFITLLYGQQIWAAYLVLLGFS